METKPKILFLCTGNSCRSQMAEAWTRRLKGDALDAFSAGVNPGTVDSKAVRVMAEAGIDISKNKSKHASEFIGMQFDYAVTVCDHAQKTCPFFPAKTRLVHHSFDDPPRLSKGLDEEAALKIYRRVRDEIRAFVEKLPEGLNS